MRSESSTWIVAGAMALIFGGLVGFGASGATVVFIALLGIVFIVFIGSSITTPRDRAWLPRWVALGFIVKLAGTAVRYYMTTVFYGVGDAYRYYTVGTDLATQWRNGEIPELTGTGSFGTQVVEAFTGGLFAIVPPDMFGGFLIFAIVAFLGQLMFYAAFRRHAEDHQLKPYAILIFLLPTFAFWPSSIGKDALVIFALGASAYFVARALEAFQIRWLALLALSLAGLGSIRIHIAGLCVGAFAVAALIARIRNTSEPGIWFRRILTLGAGVAAAALVISLFPDLFGVDILSAEDRDGFTADLVRRTSESGTVAEGGDTTPDILSLPKGLALVLFRPYVFEATELQHFMAAAETGLLALLTVWRLPAVLRNIRRWRSNPYVVFATVYTAGFAIAFSLVRNLGIIARQRGQVLAFFLCFLIYLGWEDKQKDPGTDDHARPRELIDTG